MKHSEYKNLTGRLVFLAREADRTRALLTMPLSVNGNGAIVATSTPDQDGTPVEVNRAEIWRAVEAVDKDIAGLMGSLVDGFVEENQDRAKPTADCRGLIEAMAGFMSVTSTPVPGWGVLYDQTRQRTREWMDQANTWFPDLNDNQESGQESRPTSTPASIDRDKLARLFQVKFKEPRPGSDSRNPLPSGFEMFYNAIESGLKNGMYTATDFGRIAYQVQQSRVVFPAYKPGKATFAKFARLFFEAVGVEVPADIAPSRYKKTTPGADYSVYLE